MEAQDEIHALRELAGDPTVHLLEADESSNAMLLERCDPGMALRSLPVPAQDGVVADVLPRVWRSARPNHPFRHLSEMVMPWSDECRLGADRWPDAVLIEEALALFAELSQPGADDVLLATDLHAGNILSAARRPWLMIDPKPFIGDPAFDATQHLLNTRERLEADPHRTIREFASLIGVNAERVRLWLFARLAAEPREVWDRQELDFARQLGS